MNPIGYGCVVPLTPNCKCEFLTPPPKFSDCEILISSDVIVLFMDWDTLLPVISLNINCVPIEPFDRDADAAATSNTFSEFTYL